MNADATRSTIVVGLDESPDGLAALTWARTNAGPHDRIVTMRAWDLPTMLDAAGPDAAYGIGFDQLAKDRLEEDLAGIDDPRLVPLVRRGRPGEQIALEAEEAALIVVGHRGDSRISMMLGSTANYVLHHARCPVVVARGRGDEPVRRVVVGVDAQDLGEGQAENASVRAVRWAYDRPGVEEVCLLHAWFPPPLVFGAYAEPVFVIDDEMGEWAATEIARVAAAAGPAPAGVRISHRVVRNPAGPALTEASNDADLVVVGSRGRGALRGLLLGSTSAEVAARSHASVAVVR